MEDISVIIDGQEIQVSAKSIDQGYLITIEGTEHEIIFPSIGNQPKTQRKKRKKNRGGNVVSSMPGNIIEISVQKGDEVEEGDLILILEAMKMQNEMRAQVSGTITEINCEVGESVEANTALVEINPREEA